MDICSGPKITPLGWTSFSISFGKSHEDFGFIRFRNLNQIRTYFKTAAPEVAGDVKKFVNFYTKAFNEIKENGFFKMTTYRFIVVARNK